MSILTATSASRPRSVVQRARWFLLAFHVPLVVNPPVRVLTFAPLADPLSAAAPVGLAALALGGLQLRHSFAAARGERPRGWPWTLAAVAALAYLPLPWFGWEWAAAQFFVIASSLMLLPRRIAVTVVAVIFLCVPLASGITLLLVYDQPLPAVLWGVLYWIVGLSVGGLGMYGAARLVRVLDELQVARAELAELAVGRERLRVSRDLHDLLGHSLSAVALKGDLAGRLLRQDPHAAYVEIVGLTGVARDALRSIRSVTHAEHVVSLRTEVDGAAALLRAADIDATVDLALGDLPPAIDEVLAWTVREGITNLLRHADARRCSIVGTRRGGSVRLEILNDGARMVADETSAPGSGLTGLTERAKAVHGTLSATRRSDDTFRLLLEVPEAMT